MMTEGLLIVVIYLNNIYLNYDLCLLIEELWGLFYCLHECKSLLSRDKY